MALGLSGFTLQFTGFDVKNASQSPHVLSSLKNAYVFIPLLFWGIAIVIALRYCLNRGRMAGIRAELEARRGVF